MNRRRALLTAAGALLLGFGNPAHAFVQANTKADGTGSGLHWGTRNVPYLVNDPNVSTGTALAATDVCGAPPAQPNPAIAAVQASFAAWTQATDTTGAPCTNLQLTFQGTTTSTNTGNDGQNVVVFRRGPCTSIVPPSDSCGAATSAACADKYNCWSYASSIIALTTNTYYSTGQIIDSDMELNAWDGTSSSFPSVGFYFTCVDPVGTGTPSNACSAPAADNCIRIDVRNTVTHEAGHFIGLAHNCALGDPTYGAPLCSDPVAQTASYLDATMYPSAPPYEVKKRTLEADDMAGVCAIYPINGGGGGGGGCGLGSAGPESLLGLLALLSLRRRGR